MKIKAQLSDEKLEKFRHMVEAFIENGSDISLSRGQTAVDLYLDCEAGWCLSLDVDGTWRLE